MQADPKVLPAPVAVDPGHELRPREMLAPLNQAVVPFHPAISSSTSHPSQAPDSNELPPPMPRLAGNLRAFLLVFRWSVALNHTLTAVPAMQFSWLNAADRAFLIVSFALEAILLTRLGLHLATRRKSILSWATRFRSDVWKVLSPFWSQVSGTEDPQVQEEICHWIIQTYRRYPPVVTTCAFGSILSFQWSLMAGRPMVMPKPLCWTILVVLMELGLLTFNRELINRKTLSFWYGTGVLLCTTALLPGFVPKEERLLWSLVVFCFYRLPATALAPRLSLVILSNLGFTTVSLLELYLDTEMKPNYANGSDRKYVAAWLEVLLLILAIGNAFSQRATIIENVKQRISHANTECELAAATSLLHLTCDAVIELGEDLRMTSHSTNLATMLLRNHPGSTLVGTHFTDFLPPAEVERAQELLCKAAKDSEPQDAVAQAFHTRMVDSCASQFRTEAFHVRYVAWNGATHHVIGLRDFTDQESLAQGRATDAILEQTQPQQQIGISPLRRSSSAPGLSSPSSRSNGHALPHQEPLHQSLYQIEGPAPTKFGASTKVPDALAMQQELNFLEIDMNEFVVNAASVALDFLVGSPVKEVFQDEGVKLLEQVHEQAVSLEKDGQLSSRSFTYGDCALNWSNGQTVYLDGVVHVFKVLNLDELRFVMCFGTPFSNPRRRTSRHFGRHSLRVGSPSRLQPHSLAQVAARRPTSL
eukprot:symbB.v1.2.025993.t1/scaffold2562.1/size76343/2